MTDLREQYARIIDPKAWVPVIFSGDPDWHPDDQRLEQNRSLAKADAILALLPQPAVPEGWEPTDDEVRDWAETWDDAAVERAALALDPEKQHALVERCARNLGFDLIPEAHGERRYLSGLTGLADYLARYEAWVTDGGYREFFQPSAQEILAWRAALAALPTPPKDEDR